jgi:hypothetical protein
MKHTHHVMAASEAAIQDNFYDLSGILDGRVKPGHGVVRRTSGKREEANSCSARHASTVLTTCFICSSVNGFETDNSLRTLRRPARSS